MTITTFFHLTAAKNVEKILDDGLLPTKAGTGLDEGCMMRGQYVYMSSYAPAVELLADLLVEDFELSGATRIEQLTSVFFSA